MKDLAAFLLLESILLNTVPPDHLALLISELLDDPRRTRPRLSKRDVKPSKVRATPSDRDFSNFTMRWSGVSKPKFAESLLV